MIAELDQTIERILKAYHLDRDDWRTIGGISRSSGLDPSEVERYVKSHPDRFLPSPIAPSGIALYGLTDQFKSALNR